MSDEILMEVLVEDQNLFSTIGSRVIKYGDLCLNKGVSKWFNIFKKNIACGKIHI